MSYSRNLYSTMPTSQDGFHRTLASHGRGSRGSRARGRGRGRGRVDGQNSRNYSSLRNNHENDPDFYKPSIGIQRAVSIPIGTDIIHNHLIATSGNIYNRKDSLNNISCKLPSSSIVTTMLRTLEDIVKPIDLSMETINKISSILAHKYSIILIRHNTPSTEEIYKIYPLFNSLFDHLYYLFSPLYDEIRSYAALLGTDDLVSIQNYWMDIETIDENNKARAALKLKVISAIRILGLMVYIQFESANSRKLEAVRNCIIGNTWRIHYSIDAYLNLNSDKKDDQKSVDPSDDKTLSDLAKLDEGIKSNAFLDFSDKFIDGITDLTVDDAIESSKSVKEFDLTANKVDPSGEKSLTGYAEIQTNVSENDRFTQALAESPFVRVFKFELEWRDPNEIHSSQRANPIIAAMFEESERTLFGYLSKESMKIQK